MDLKSIESYGDLKSNLSEDGKCYLLLYRSGSDRSDCAFNTIKNMESEIAESAIILTADVNTVKDIHEKYGIDSVPVLLQFNGYKLLSTYKGCNGEHFYSTLFSGGNQVKLTRRSDKSRSVTVYSTPSCSWCTTLKNYLRDNRVIFRDIDVSSDQKAAEEMVRKSGQQGVPQTDINGQVIIGFDKARIDRLLEINV